MLVATLTDKNLINEKIGAIGCAVADICQDVDGFREQGESLDILVQETLAILKEQQKNQVGFSN